MDGAQDMGGVEGFGPVKIEPNERFSMSHGNVACSE